MNIGYVQFKPEFGEIGKNLNKIGGMLKGVSADLIVLPELFNTGYYVTDISEMHDLAEEIPNGPTCRRLSEIAKSKKMNIVAGILEKENDRFYNSAVLMGEKGYIDHYRKIHLFDEEKLYFTPGDRPFKVYDVGTAKIGIMICFDWYFPESARTLSLLGADIICHPSNLVLPHCPDIMPVRALENRVFTITANRTGSDVKGEKSLSFIGRSTIAAPDGSVLKRAGTDNEVVDIVSINPEDARNKRIKTYNDLFLDRRPEMYGVITEKNLQRNNSCR